MAFDEHDGVAAPAASAAAASDSAKILGLLEAAPDAILAVDRSGIINLVNAQAERLFGYARVELIGQPVELLVPESVRAVHPLRRAAYVADPRPRPMGAGMELAGRRKDGSEFPAEISLSAIDTADGILVAAAVRDVTDRIEARAERERLKAQAERERLERQLHQSQRLESLGQLAGGVAHDFNNLMAAILNYAMFVGEEVVAEAEAATDPVQRHRWEQVRDDVFQVQRAAERATELTHQLLRFGRREVVQPRVLNLNDIVTAVEQLLRRTIGAQVTLRTDLAADLWSVSADPGQLEQVLMNLSINARDAMPGGGTLLIETTNLDVDADYLATRPELDIGRYVRLAVSDTGPGMAPDVVARAFEPFFSTKPKGEGSGLGLATVYGIVSQAGGVATLYSEEGVGTTFSALLPVVDAAPTKDDTAHAAPQAGDGLVVLVVEDEDAMREVTRRILNRNGHDVLVAATGEEAIELAQQYAGSIDLLLTDVVMPQMLGKEVAERVQAICPRAKVLFMSGYAQPVLTSQGTLADGVELVGKPFTEAGLLEKIQRTMEA